VGLCHDGSKRRHRGLRRGHGGSENAIDPGQKRQLAVIEYLAQSGADVKMYSSESGRSQLQILMSCCRRQPHSGTQRQVCGIFGLRSEETTR